jgi:lysozyme family protein
MSERGAASGSSEADSSRSPPPRFAVLADEYSELWATCTIGPDRVGECDRQIDKVLQDASRRRYDAVAGSTGVPWWAVATLHLRESSLSFAGHLHNGDPLARPTRQVPKGRPPGPGPFTWEESAADALTFDRFAAERDWRPARACWSFERFNGFGYRRFHPEVKSPYLWSFTNHYRQGKYAADGRFDPKLIDRQCGTMALLKRMEQRQLIRLEAAAPAPSVARGVPATARARTAAFGPELVALAEQHLGEAYVLGARAPFTAAAHRGPWDCAEFCSWLLYRCAGVAFGCVRNDAPPARLDPYSGAWFRDAMASGAALPVEAARGLAGAFLVRRPVVRLDGTVLKVGHVAMTDGRGGTIEAMGKAHGVARGRISGRGFDLCVVVPGVGS